MKSGGYSIQGCSQRKRWVRETSMDENSRTASVIASRVEILRGGRYSDEGKKSRPQSCSSYTHMHASVHMLIKVVSFSKFG